MRRRLLLAVALAAMTGSGCASAINMQDAAMRKPYGGFTMPLDDFFGGSEAGEYVVLRFWPIWLIDKPLSLFADTVSLPYTLWVQREAGRPQKGQSTVPSPRGGTWPLEKPSNKDNLASPSKFVPPSSQEAQSWKQ